MWPISLRSMLDEDGISTFKSPFVGYPWRYIFLPSGRNQTAAVKHERGQSRAMSKPPNPPRASR